MLSSSLLLVVIVLVALMCNQLDAYRVFPKQHLAISSSRRHLFGSPEPPKSPVPKKDAGGLFGGMGNLMDSMKKAQEIAKQAEVMNKELGETMITAKDPSGQVTVTYNGLGVPVSMQVSDSILSQGAEAVSLAATQAMKEGHEKSQMNMVARMQALYANAGIQMPNPGK